MLTTQRALAGSAMIANAPGTVMDISREENRALAFSIWSIGPMNGPVTGPLIGTYIPTSLLPLRSSHTFPVPI
jgi:MFS family permease